MRRVVESPASQVVEGRTTRQPENPRTRRPAPELIVVGCSLGGMKAIQTILLGLPKEFCIPIVVAQHRHRRSNEELPSFFRRTTHMRVVDADDKQWIKPSTVYLAPADYHLLVAKGELNLSVDDAVRFSRPSIDVLFESAADAYGSAVIGVILTGANEDGTEGAARIKKRGGTVIAQDPATAEAAVMPQSAIDAGAVDRILPLDQIASALVELCHARARQS